MTDDIRELFVTGGMLLAVAFAGLLWYPALMRSAGDPVATVEVFRDGLVLLIYSVYPTSPLAVYVDLAVAGIASVVSAKGGIRGRGVIMAAGAGWVLANMAMTALNPPI